MHIFLIEFEFGKSIYIVAESILEAIKRNENKDERIKRITDLGFCTIVEKSNE